MQNAGAEIGGELIEDKVRRNYRRYLYNIDMCLYIHQNIKVHFVSQRKLEEHMRMRAIDNLRLSEIT